MLNAARPTAQSATVRGQKLPSTSPAKARFSATDANSSRTYCLTCRKVSLRTTIPRHGGTLDTGTCRKSFRDLDIPLEGIQGRDGREPER